MRHPLHRPARTAALGLAAAVAGLASVEAAIASCGTPGAGHCAMPHSGTGCSDTACCQAVCNVDPFCCDVGWDEYCGRGAVEVCGFPVPTIVVMAFGVSAVLPGGVEVQACDLAGYNTSSGTWSVYFDGDDVGFTGQVIRAATITPAGDLLLATNGGAVAGLLGGPAGNAFDSFDVLRFTPTALGADTAGTWTFHLDGSDVGLAGSANRAYRGLGLLPDGSMLVVTFGSSTLPGVGAFETNDVIRFLPTSLGSVTAGTWSMHFDGSDVDLSSSTERLDSVFRRADGSLILSLRSGFAVTGLTGTRADLVRFNPTSLGTNTAGSYSMAMTGASMGVPGDLNPHCIFETQYTYPVGPRPGGGGGGGGGSTLPVACGEPGTGDCCMTSETPFCSDTACCEAVCAVDPLCCNTAWDEYCVGQATSLCTACMPNPKAVMGFGTSTSLPGGVSLSPCDLASYDLVTGQWAVWFDGDDVGLTGRTVWASAVLPNGDILMGLDAGGSLPGLTGGPNGTAYEMYDILRFTPTSLGATTAGSWSFHFDGSDVGYTGNGELSFRGLSVLPDGSLLIVTKGSASLPGIGAITANDVVRFTPTSTGAATAGTWSMYFDGSDVGLSTANNRLDAVSYQPNGRLVLSVRSSISVPGFSAGRSDLFDFIPTSVGDNTAGSFQMRLTAATSGVPSTVNALGCFVYTPTFTAEPRPLLPVLFDRLPDASLSAAAVADGHAEYIIVYQGVDPNAGSTGLINTQLVIDSIRAEHGNNPTGYGILDFEYPFITRLEAGPSDPDWQMTVNTVVAALQAVKAEFPQVKWTMYSMPLARYWIDFTWSWADVPAPQREAKIQAILAGFDPVLRECDWLNPSAYDRYELATYSAGQQGSKTAQEVAWREAMVEICNRFNQSSGLARKPIIPMVSPMFWKVGQISYNMKMIGTEEILRDTVRPLINEGADGVAFWTGLSYWVRAATSVQDLGEGQTDSRYAFMMDFYGGVAPADWTAPAVRADLEVRISQHVKDRLDDVRGEIYDLKIGSAGN